jgi:hypothetical protein
VLALVGEKDRRIYYQDIVYSVCNSIDKILGLGVGTGIACGTNDHPSNEVQDRMLTIAARIAELEAIIAKHDLCHDLHGKVGREEFEEGCRRETVKEFGSCGWADRIAELERQLAIACRVDLSAHEGTPERHAFDYEVLGRLEAAEERVAELERQLAEAAAQREYFAALNRSCPFDGSTRVPDESAVAAEREACAKLAEQPYSDDVCVVGPESPINVGNKVAAAIRVRGQS